ncbi:MAG: hypothetical protein R2932_41485 [Caldilineaceae bacterium]
MTHQYTTERLAICRVLGDQRGIAYCLADLGYNALFCDLPDPAAAQQYFDEMAVVSDLLGHPSVRADLWFGLAQVAYFKEDWDAARHYLAENLAIVDAGHNQREVTLVHLWLGEVALAEGALREAQRRFSTVLQQASEMSNIPVMLLGLEGLAKTVLRQGLVAQALPICPGAAPPEYLGICA